MSDSGSKEIRSVPVRTRRTVGATRRLVESTVQCPRQESAIPASHCLGCEHCTGAEGDRRGVRLRCTTPAGGRADIDAPLDLRVAASHTPLSDVMTHDVICVFRDLSIVQFMELLKETGISGVPVVDDAGIPVGVVSKTDLMGASLDRPTVGDIMMPVAFTLPETASLSHAAALMSFEDIHRILIVSASGRVTGIVTALDIVRWLADRERTAAVCR